MPLASRNHCMLIFYIVLITSGSTVYTLKVVPFFGSTNLFCVVTYLLIVVDVLLFVACNRKDPGIITPENIDNYIDKYQYDGLYYTQSTCRTCGTEKPARSKHCCKFTCVDQSINKLYLYTVNSFRVYIHL